jgi:hypothetical protein
MDGALKMLKVTKKYGKIHSISKSGTKIHALLFNDIVLWTKVGMKKGQKTYTLVKPPSQILLARDVPNDCNTGDSLLPAYMIDKKLNVLC